jgi:heme/copper-type cytochrome/quinol oxidase subunit 3
MVIEGAMFAMTVMTYFYLRLRVSQWPPSVPLPDATAGTLTTLVLLVSCVPNQLTKRAAEKYDLGRVQPLLLVCAAFGLAAIVIRAFEFTALNTTWEMNAYGSIVWVLLGLHTIHLVTDWADTCVLMALMFSRHVEPKRFVDVSENALYWYFIVFSWLPIYVVLYFGARWL